MITPISKEQQRGVVLIVVLWVLALLMLLLAAFSTSVRVDRQISSELVQRAQTRAGVDGALAYLAAINKIGGDTWVELRGQVLILPLPSGQVRFRLVPEEAYLSLTGAPEELIKMLIAGLASDQTDIDLALASLLDRRQLQLTARAQSFEAEELKREPLHSIEELLLLPGFDRSLVERMAPLVTIDSRHTGVAVRFATPQLLELVTGDQRLAAALQAMPDEIPGGAELPPSFLSAPAGRIFRLQVEAGEGRQRRRAEVTVVFDEEGEDYQIARWNEYNPQFYLD